METLEELQEILNDAPEGATNYAACIDLYLKHNARGEFIYHDGKTFCSFSLKSRFLKRCKLMRSLADIQRIVDLKVALNSAWESINEAGYEDFNNELSDFMSEEL